MPIAFLTHIGIPHRRSMSLLYLFRRAAHLARQTRSARNENARIPRKGEMRIADFVV
jgi:hypothetical protein